MSWVEFCSLLSGIMPNTPLGQIVSIRAERDKNIIKNFTKEQRHIRDEWFSRKLKKAGKNKEKGNVFLALQSAFKAAYEVKK